MIDSMKFRAISANCGNDLIGEQASELIATRLDEDELDFVVINCQEVNIEQTRQQLLRALGEPSEYSVALLSKMVTHTKPREQLHGNTGLASFAIHKKSLSVQVTERVKARRHASRFSGSGYNKGGLVTTFSVTDSTNRTIRLQAITGHLDSKSTSKRIKDWAAIHSAIGKKSVNNWSELVAAMPNIRIAGYDANTRNKYIDERHEPVNIWTQDIVPQELQAFQQAPLGGVHYSLPSTYKTSDATINATPDPKRPGYVRGGMMDFVDVASDVEYPSSPICITERVECVGCEPNTTRDHDVIISPLQTYDASAHSEFERVKHQMMIQLRACAPHLVKEMASYTAQDEKKLINIYNDYLSKHGLVNKQIRLQSDFLKQMSHIKKLDGDIGHRIESLLLADKAWFLTDPFTMKTTQAFQSLVLHALRVCRTKSDLDTMHRMLQDPATNAVVLTLTLQSLLNKYQAGIFSEVYERSKKQVNQLLSRFNAFPVDALHSENKAGLMIQLALEFTKNIHKELSVLQESHLSGCQSVRKALIAMIEPVKVLVMRLIDLFVNERYSMSKKVPLKQIGKNICRLNLNLPFCLEQLRLSLNRNMLPITFTKIKTQVEERKLDIDNSSADKPPIIKR